MLTLFHFPKFRSGSIVWLLEELGVPNDTKLVDIRSRPAFRRMMERDGA